MDLKRAQLRNGRLRLLPENPCRPSPCCGDDAAPDVWGVVTALVHRYRS